MRRLKLLPVSLVIVRKNTCGLIAKEARPIRVGVENVKRFEDFILII